MVPYWNIEGDGVESGFSDASARRAIAMALIDSDLWDGERVDVEIRGRSTPARVVPYFLRAEAPPFARSIVHTQRDNMAAEEPLPTARKVRHLIDDALANTRWRQHDCVNLIPSEMSLSPAVKLLSIMDPLGRYAEHKQIKALDEAEVFYYQGTDFIWEVEERLKREMSAFLG